MRPPLEAVDGEAEGKIQPFSYGPHVGIEDQLKQRNCRPIPVVRERTHGRFVARLRCPGLP